MRFRFAHALSVGCALAIAGCSNGPTSPTIADLTIAAPTTTVNVYETLQLEGIARDAGGTVIEQAPITWSSSNQALATVSGTGLVTGVGVGTVAIEATSGAHTATIDLQVGPPGVATITITAPSTTIVPDETIALSATAVDVMGDPVAGHTITWSVNLSEIASIDESGNLTAHQQGGVQVTASAAGKSKSINIGIADGALVGSAGATLSMHGGDVVLTVPPGALSSTARIYAQEVSDLPMDPAAVRQSAFEVLGPDDLTFATPATVRLRYDPTLGPFGLPESQYRVHRLGGTAWQSLAGAGSVDAAGNTVTGETTSLGVFGVRRGAPAGGCTGPAHRQFDFWLGEWDVGIGVESTISGETEGCAIYEHYRPPGLVGRSISFYNEETGLWYQTYLTTGSPLPLPMSGGLEGSKMVMYVRDAEGEITQKWTWETSGNNVIQRSFGTTDGGVTYTPGFVGTYTPKP